MGAGILKYLCLGNPFFWNNQYLLLPIFLILVLIFFPAFERFQSVSEHFRTIPFSACWSNIIFNLWKWHKVWIKNFSTRILISKPFPLFLAGTYCIVWCNRLGVYISVYTVLCIVLQQGVVLQHKSGVLKRVAWFVSTATSLLLFA